MTDSGLRERIGEVRRRLAADGPPLTRALEDDFARVSVPPRNCVVDDHCWPSVRTAERYFEKNMGWRAMPGIFAGRTTDQASGEPRLRALRLPDPSFEPAFEDFQPFQ